MLTYYISCPGCNKTLNRKTKDADAIRPDGTVHISVNDLELLHQQVEQHHYAVEKCIHGTEGDVKDLIRTVIPTAWDKGGNELVLRMPTRQQQQLQHQQQGASASTAAPSQQQQQQLQHQQQGAAASRSAAESAGRHASRIRSPRALREEPQEQQQVFILQALLREVQYISSMLERLPQRLQRHQQQDASASTDAAPAAAPKSAGRRRMPRPQAQRAGRSRRRSPVAIHNRSRSRDARINSRHAMRSPRVGRSRIQRTERRARSEQDFDNDEYSE